jgi:prepilin signal peptidase PulO-like enzyme (type II secretory pathway)
MKTKFKYTVLCLMTMLFAIAAFAQDTIPAPAETIEGFFSQTLTFIKQFGGLPWVLKIAGISAILISTLKISVLREFTWDKLGNAKVWAAPVLGLVFGIASQGTAITLSSALAYISAGAGAIILHELLESVKAIPGIGSVWLSIIGVIQSLLGGKKDNA